MNLYRMNGAGNAFVILDARDGGLRPSAEEVRALAHAGDGPPADQVIAMESGADGGLFMRIWNRDGTEAGACGNATRCVAWLALEESGAEEVVVETVAGRLPSRRAGPMRIAVDMGVPKLDWRDIPLAERMDTRGIDLKIGPIDKPYLSLPGCVNMGNPHCVFFVPDLDAVDIAAVGSLVEWHPLFPEGVNVGFAQITSPATMRLRTWERGVGRTLACGTNICAAVVAGHRRRLCGRRVAVANDGGAIEIDWREADDHVIMTGPVELESAPGRNGSA